MAQEPLNVSLHYGFIAVMIFGIVVGLYQKRDAIRKLNIEDPKIRNLAIQVAACLVLLGIFAIVAALLRK